jgi:8-hydroxy-5-deazaflavin:NADPH oxidoreductase
MIGGKPVKVGVLGGTGRLGSGLSLRLSASHEVLVGSRDAGRAERKALEISRASGREIVGGANGDAARRADAAILAIPYSAVAETLNQLRDELSGKLVISAVVPMLRTESTYGYSLAQGSAAEEIAGLLPRSRIAAAFHTVPARPLSDLGSTFSAEVPVVAASRADYEEAAGIVGSIQGLRPLYAGTLQAARWVESLTPFLLNIGLLNRMKDPTLRLLAQADSTFGAP